MSHAKRPARASVTARCTTFSLEARQSCTLMPERFSKVSVSGTESLRLSEVYITTSRSFFASAARRASRPASCAMYTARLGDSAAGACARATSGATSAPIAARLNALRPGRGPPDSFIGMFLLGRARYRGREKKSGRLGARRVGLHSPARQRGARRAARDLPAVGNARRVL